MGNPVMAPAPAPPQPPVPPRAPRSIAGAVVLILLGVLFLLGTMGIVGGHELAVIFSKFWPLLLILWGIVKLIEHEQAKRVGLQSRGIGVGGVFLMLFVIVAGLTATGIAHCKSTIRILTRSSAGQPSTTTATCRTICRLALPSSRSTMSAEPLQSMRLTIKA